MEDFFSRENISGLESISTEFELKLNIFIKLFILLYADDTVLMAESARDLQKQLDKFYDYCQLWKLKVNVEKTKIMIFSKGRQPANINFNYNGVEIDIVKDFNYLGVLLSRTGSFKACKSHLSEKATKAMYEVIRKGRTHNLSISCQLDLFDKLVKPILLYGCEIWGYGNNAILEKVQLKFCKLLLHLRNTTPTCMIYGELGRYPIEIDIKVRMISFWANLLTGKDSKLSCLAYKLLLSLTDTVNFKSDWLESIKNIFNECGMPYIWRNQNFMSSTWLKLTIKTCLQDQYKQTWHANVQNSPVTLNYRIFKESFELEKYFDILDKKDMYTLCKFRMLNHKLPIETGRWNNIQREDRKCNLCDLNDLGDEFHYLFKCKQIDNKRKECIDKKFSHRPNILKFKNLMSSTKKSLLKKLCSLIRFINSSLVVP